MTARNLITAKEHSKEKYDQKIKPFLGKVGDQVYVKKEAKVYGKLDDKYHGPYTLVKILDKNNAILGKPDEKLFQKHFDKLKLVYSWKLKNFNHSFLLQENHVRY